MDNGWSWEQKTLITELVQGMEVAKQLRGQLNGTLSIETSEFLVQKILSSYEKALLMLNWSDSSSSSMAQPQATTAAAVGVTGTVPESPLSMNGSPRSDDFDGSPKENQWRPDASKKRKKMPRWTDHVKVSSENGLEGTHDDGYSWRKYGQKDILAAKYPRSYYRCTYRNTRNCWATKQVQRSDEDPTIFEVTYRGTHTCSHGSSVPQPASPEKQEQKQSINNYQSQEALFNLQKSLRVNTDNLYNKEIDFAFTFPSTYGCTDSVGGHSQSFISPATPEPNYSVAPFQMSNYGGVQTLQHSESDFTEIISANNSVSNSPIVDLDFSLEAVELDPNFPFDTPGFFT